MPIRPAIHRPKTHTGHRTETRPDATQRGYDRRWRNARQTFLNEYPLCRACEAAGRLEAATVVDHVIPHRGDNLLFWDQSNWQPLCKPCHDAKTGRGE